MSKSITCNFQMNINTSKGTQFITGVNSVKEAKEKFSQMIEFAAKNTGDVYTSVELWPQTSKGQKLAQGFDFIRITPSLILYKERISDLWQEQEYFENKGTTIEQD